MLDRASWEVQADFASRLKIRGYSTHDTPSFGVIRGIRGPQNGPVSPVSQDERPLIFEKAKSHPNYINKMNVILYTRTDCHLCDIAEQVLAEHGLQTTQVDIDADESLREQFDTCVPVVEIDGKIRFRGRVNPILLKRLLQYPQEQP